MSPGKSPLPPPSLLDVLVAGRVRGGADSVAEMSTPGSRRAALGHLRRSIERDLEMLLCTRQRHLAWPATLDALVGSILNYGVVDRSGTNLASSRAREELRQSIEATIRAFEPRISHLAVRLLAPREGDDRRLRFEIQGQLRFDGEAMILNSVLDPVKRTFSI